MKRNNKKGFTIVELVIVIAVIGILAAVLIPTFGSVINNAKESAALQEARSKYTEYLAAHPDKKIDYIMNEDGTIYYDINDEFKAYKVGGENVAPTEGVLTIGTCLEKKGTGENAATTCSACGWTLTENAGTGNDNAD